MYIKLTEPILNLALSQSEGSKEAMQLLDYLDIAVRLGKHFVFGDIHVIELLSKLPGEYIGLKGLHAMYSEYGNMTTTFNWHAEFILSGKSHKDRNQKIIFINYKDVPKFELYVESRLVCEHLNDAHVYKLILEEYKRLKGFDIRSNFYPLLGGGSTTSIVYKHEVDEARTFVLCLSDSDYKYEGSSLGDTAKNIKKINDRSPFNAEFYHLEKLAESENLFPIKIYREYVDCKNDDKLKQTCSLYENIHRTNEGFLRYIDFKKGITLSRLQNLKQEDNIKDIALVIKEDLDAWISSETTSVNAEIAHVTDAELQKEEFKKRCKKKVILSGFGENILGNILDYIRDYNKTEIFDGATGYQLHEINTIGSLVYDWSASMEPIKS